MGRRVDRPSLIASFLLIFILAVAGTIWLLDLVAQQRVFGFLLSAEFVAFSMLVYLYYKDTFQEVSRKWLSAGVAAIVLLVVLSAAVFAGIGTGLTPNVNVTLYAGEISSTQYGFGNTSSTLSSPGPTLTFKVGDVVKLTLNDVGQMPHNWAIVSANASSAPVLFNAQIHSGDTPLVSGQSGTVIFTVTQPGNFFYICQVPGHLLVGMWGNITVTP